MQKIIIEANPEDYILAIRAARYLQAEINKDKEDAIISYDYRGVTKDFYVRRNKKSIRVLDISRN